MTERILPSCFTHQVSRAKARNQELYPGLTHGWQESKLLDHLPLLFPGYQQEVGSKVKQSARELELIWDVSVAGGGFTS